MPIIIDDNGEVKTVKYIGEKTIEFSELLEILPQTQQETGILPDNCIAYMKSSNTELFLIETKAGIRYMTYIDGRGGREQTEGKKYRLYMPWTYCLITRLNGIVDFRCTENYMVFAGEKVTSFDSPMFMMPMPTMSYLEGNKLGSFCTAYNGIANRRGPANISVNAATDDLLNAPYAYPCLYAPLSSVPKFFNPLSLTNPETQTVTYLKRWQDLTAKHGEKKMDELFKAHGQAKGYKYEKLTEVMNQITERSR